MVVSSKGKSATCSPLARRSDLTSLLRCAVLVSPPSAFLPPTLLTVACPGATSMCVWDRGSGTWTVPAGSVLSASAPGYQASSGASKGPLGSTFRQGREREGSGQGGTVSSGFGGIRTERGEEEVGRARASAQRGRRCRKQRSGHTVLLTDVNKIKGNGVVGFVTAHWGPLPMGTP